jgi:hypothetical protein
LEDLLAAIVGDHRIASPGYAGDGIHCRHARPHGDLVHPWPDALVVLKRSQQIVALPCVVHFARGAGRAGVVGQPGQGHKAVKAVELLFDVLPAGHDLDEQIALRKGLGEAGVYICIAEGGVVA